MMEQSTLLRMGRCKLRPDHHHVVPKDNESIAEEKKNLGYEQYKAQNYLEALTYYSDAISLCPESAVYYGSRSACYMMLAKYPLALIDARAAVHLDPSLGNYSRIIRLCILLGDLKVGEHALAKLLELDPHNEFIKPEQEMMAQLRQLDEIIKAQLELKFYRNVVYYVERALQISPHCIKYRLLKAECLIYLERYDEALDIAVGVMKIDSTSANAIYIRGLCLYFADNLEKSVMHFEQTLQLDPDHKKAKEMRNKSRALRDLKISGNTFFSNGQYREARDVYTDALKVDDMNRTINSKLLYNRGLVNSKVGDHLAAANDCTAALAINGQYLKALLLRARCYHHLERFEDCVIDYEAAWKFHKTIDIKRWLQEAKLNLKKSKRKDFYKILQVTRCATDDEIKRAYRKKALLHHPDRHATSPLEIRRAEEMKFKMVGEAYAVLSDPQQKLRYDKCYDSEDRENPDFDSQPIFRTFFHFNDDMETPPPFPFEF